MHYVDLDKTPGIENFESEVVGVSVPTPDECYVNAFKKYGCFKGRAPRREFWYFQLFNFIAMFGISIVEGLIGTEGVIGKLYFLAALLPSIGLMGRRLHDIDMDVRWLLLMLLWVPVTLLGPVIALVDPLLPESVIMLSVLIPWLYLMYCSLQPGTMGVNRFGEDPYFDGDEGNGPGEITSR